MIMNNNVFGIIGVGGKNAMFNAGFDGEARNNGMGDFITTSYSQKYPVKRLMDNRGQRVLGLKRVIDEKGSVATIEGAYKNLFGNNKKEKYIDVVNNLFKCEDIVNFGVAYTGSPSVSIQGAVQITDSINKWNETEQIVQDILSAYSSKEGNLQSTIGERLVLNEAHFVSDFTIFPDQYKGFINEGFKGYTRENYENLKDGLRLGYTSYNSVSKAGCQNEFLMTIELKEDQNYLFDFNGLQNLVEVNNVGGVPTYDLTKVSDLVNKVLDKIEVIEIYYDPRNIDISGMNITEKIKVYDIMICEEI